MNYETLRRDKIIRNSAKTVLHSPTPFRPQGDLGCRGTGAVVKPPSNQFPTKGTHYSLLYISENVRPSIRALGSLQTASTNKFDIPGAQACSNKDP